jgi:transmembrane sensor
MIEPRPGAKDIQEQAALWLMDVRDHADWSADDQAKLDAWLAQSHAHRIAYLRLEAAWNRTHRLAALRGGRARRSSDRKFLPLLVGAAATLAVAAVLGMRMLSPQVEPAKIYKTALGEHKTIALTDGSEIELNTDTILRIASDNARKVWLDKGEAYFQIKHDAAHPFTAMVEGHRVVDLGTKFRIRERADRVEVALLEGAARFESADDSIRAYPVYLSPGDVVVAKADSMSVLKRAPQELSNELGWRRGVLIFKHTVLSEAAAEFNRYNATKLIIATPSIAKVEIGGTFPSDDVAAFARVARDLLKLHVEFEDREVVISR